MSLLIFKVTSSRRISEEISLEARSGAFSDVERAPATTQSRWPGAVSASARRETGGAAAVAPTEEKQVSSQSPSELEQEVEQRLQALRARSGSLNAAPSSTISPTPTPTNPGLDSLTNPASDSAPPPIEPVAAPEGLSKMARANDRSRTSGLPNSLDERLPLPTAPLREVAAPAPVPTVIDRTAEIERDNLRAENVRLRAEVQTVVQANERMKRLEAEQLAANISARKVETELSKFREENDRLRSGFDKLRERSESERKTLTSQQSATESKLQGDLQTQSALNSELQSALNDLKKEVTSLRKSKLSLEETAKAFEVTKKELADLREANRKLEAEASKLSKESSGAQESAKKAVRDLEAKLAEQTAQAQQSGNELLKMGSELAQVKQQQDDLQRELVDARSSLLLAQAQLEALNKASPTSNRSTSVTAPVVPAAPVTNTASRRVPPPAERGDFQFVQVVVPKANLRAGPGDENSVVMEVPQDSVLLVEEKRGEWFRIISPTGSRAWIRQDVVRVPGSQPDFSASRPALGVTRTDDETVAAPIVPKPTRQKAPPRAAPAPDATPPMAEEFDDEATKAYQRLKESLGNGKGIE